MDRLVQILAETLHPATQKQGNIKLLLSFIKIWLLLAENTLKKAENDSDFGVNLLALVTKQDFLPSLKLAAVIYLKNYIKRVWSLVNSIIFFFIF